MGLPSYEDVVSRERGLHLSSLTIYGRNQVRLTDGCDWFVYSYDERYCQSGGVYWVHHHLKVVKPFIQFGEVVNPETLKR